MVKRDWIACSKYDNRSTFIKQHNLEWDLYDLLMCTRIFIIYDLYDVHMSSKNYKESGYNLKLDLPTISY